ncbi:hypothetical protein MMC18_001713 [Xylographa bjoerkii]|nr:hypothetical protein [Xylographa bjoerkii]
MTTPHGMEIYASRLASFDTAQPTTKRKRVSGAKGAKPLKWPHKRPSLADLAMAGFFYAPTISCSDNAICFICEKGLDGWEEEDNPVKEHLNYSPECGWAINMAIEQELEEGIREDEDPMSTKMLEAQAGWYHCPTAESDDFVKCASDGYDSLTNSLLNKESEEHQRRSPECAFFILSQSINVKPTRAKQGRPSKASRMSTQSNVTTALEDLSMLEVTAEEGDSIATAGTNMITASTASKMARKFGKTMIGKGKAWSKAVETVTAEEGAPNSSFVEPEDDDFEVKVDKDATKDHQGKKRSSSEMECEDPPLEGAVKSAKRRVTRTRSSTVKPQSFHDHAGLSKTASDTHIIDAEDMPPPTLRVSKKGGKPSRKRGSSTARIPSSKSIASKASLRSVPTDTEIEAALEADLNRPLTDDEAEEEVCRERKSRRLTRSRAESKQAPASIAAARETTQFSTESVDDPQIEVVVENLKSSEVKVALSTTDDTLQLTSTSLTKGYPTTVKTKPKKTKGQTKVSILPKALKEQDIMRVEQEHSIIDQPPAIEVIEMAQGNTQDNEAAGRSGSETLESSIKKRSAAPQKSTPSRTRQSSRRLTGRRRAVSVVSAADAPLDFHSGMENSGLTTKTAADESLHESDTNIMTGAPLESSGKKEKAVKKGKKSKKMDLPSRQIKKIVPASMERAEEDHALNPTLQIISRKGEAWVEASFPLVSTTDLEERTTAREGSAELVNPVQKAEEVPKPKPGRGRPKGKTSLSSSRMAQKRDERTPEPQALPSQESSTTSVNAAQILASSSKLTATFTPTLQPPSPKPAVPSPTPSPQSSDAENQPPSSRPSQQRPPLFETSPSRPQTIRIPLAASTPNTSPSRRNIASSVQTTLPWTTVDVENIFLGSAKATQPLPQTSVNRLKDCLSSPEKEMTVEEWIQFNAEKGEEDLRNECERLVGRFEGEGNRALRTLEGIICED